MSTSDISQKRQRAARICRNYIILSAACAAFGVVYEQFSHGVFSGYMAFAFLFLLLLGALPAFLAAAFNINRHPKRACRNLHNSGVATLTVGSLCKGALDIYGTTSALISVYWWLGAALIAAGLAAFIFQSEGQIRHENGA